MFLVFVSEVARIPILVAKTDDSKFHTAKLVVRRTEPVVSQGLRLLI